MDNKKIVITGASRVSVLKWPKPNGKGHTVFGAVRNPGASELRDAGLMILQLDISDQDSIDSFSGIIQSY